MMLKINWCCWLLDEFNVRCCFCFLHFTVFRLIMVSCHRIFPIDKNSHKKNAKHKQCHWVFLFVSKAIVVFICEWANTHSTHFAKHSLSHSISRSLPLQMVRYLVETNRVGRAPATERQRKKMQNYGATRNSIDFVSWIQICTLNKLVVNVNIDNKWLKCLRNCDKNGIVANVRSEQSTKKRHFHIANSKCTDENAILGHGTHL